MKWRAAEMRYSFRSGFAERLNKFVDQKMALGRSYQVFDRYLLRFDDMCSERYPNATELTREICMSWAVKNPTEGNSTFRNRMSPVREFARFLVMNGENAFVIPTDLARKPPRYTPYIYSKEEIVEVWKAFDVLNPVPNSQSRHLVLAAIVRLLYCCGLRPIEARRLMTADVDLSAGRLYIRESKGHKDRIVMMAPDVTEYIGNYDRRIRDVFPQRDYFFPSPCGGFSGHSWLNRNWLQIRESLKLNTVCGNPPRIYDFRHTFATHRLYEWMREGKDLNAMLPYLSAYMGHIQLSDTYYYIHLVPGQFETMSGVDMSRYEELLPEVEYDE
jgi:integrase